MQILLRNDRCSSNVADITWYLTKLVSLKPFFFFFLLSTLSLFSHFVSRTDKLLAEGIDADTLLMLSSEERLGLLQMLDIPQTAREKINKVLNECGSEFGEPASKRMKKDMQGTQPRRHSALHSNVVGGAGSPSATFRH